MGEIELGNKLSNNCINRCISNVPFNRISSGEEINFIFNKKLTKETAIHYQIVPETHRIQDDLKSTDIWGGVL